MEKSQADNVTMSTGGLYSLATKGAKDVIDIATPRVIQAIESINVSPHGFSISDTGCADAGTSLDMIRTVVEKISSTNPDTPITVVYADQPANDFNALINIVHGRSEFKSWLDNAKNAYPLVSGSSFYLQAVPDETLDFIFSATAMHWLSSKPCNISNHVHMVGANADELESFSAQARKDWQTILLCRAKELKPGGKMVLVNFCRNEHGQHLGNTGGVNMFNTFNEIWQSFLNNGRITVQEFENMTLPQYYHTKEEFAAPLVDPQNPCHLAGLRLESIETGVVPCPFAQAFKVDNDVEKFATGLIPTVRSWNQSIFAGGLDSGRSTEERNQLIEEYYGEYYNKVIENPDGHGMDYVHAYMTISKIATDDEPASIS